MPRPPIKEWAGKNTASSSGTTPTATACRSGKSSRSTPTGMPGSYEPYIAPDFTCYTASEDKERPPRPQIRRHELERRRCAGLRHPARRHRLRRLPAALRSRAISRTPAGPSSCTRTRRRAGCTRPSTTGRATGATMPTRSCTSGRRTGESKWTVGQRGVEPVLPGEVHMHLRGVAGVAHELRHRHRRRRAAGT